MPAISVIVPVYQAEALLPLSPAHIDLPLELLAERDALRREYIDAHKASLAAALENTYIVDEQGNKRKVQKK